MPNFVVCVSPEATLPQRKAIVDQIQMSGGKIKQVWGNSLVTGEGGSALADDLPSLPGVTLAANTDGLDVGSLNPGHDTALVRGVWNSIRSAPPSGDWSRFSEAEKLQIVDFLPPSGCDGGVPPASIPVDSAKGSLGIRANDAAAVPVVHRSRRSFVNTIGVIILEVDGPAGSSAAFTLADRADAILRISKAFDLLYTLAPPAAHLVFTTSIRHVKIDIDPNAIPVPANPSKPSPAEYANIEGKWLVPALSKLGVQTNRSAGFRELVQNGSFLFNIEWGLVLAITKYRAAWLGYSPDFRDIVISWSMQLDAVAHAGGDTTIVSSAIAHELGHTVGARDEYSPCSVLETCGFTNTPNVNCDLNPFSADCLMKNLAPSVCPATAGHFGWGDQDFDGVLDPFDSDFIYF